MFLRKHIQEHVMMVLKCWVPAQISLFVIVVVFFLMQILPSKLTDTPCLRNSTSCEEALPFMLCNVANSLQESFL